MAILPTGLLKSNENITTNNLIYTYFIGKKIYSILQPQSGYAPPAGFFTKPSMLHVLVERDK
jgi:hypothetical protein